MELLTKALQLGHKLGQLGKGGTEAALAVASFLEGKGNLSKEQHSLLQDLNNELRRELVISTQFEINLKIFRKQCMENIFYRTHFINKIYSKIIQFILKKKIRQNLELN